MRHLLVPPLHGKRLHTYGNLIVEITQGAIADWKIGSTVGIRETMSDLSLEIILRVVFGLQPGQRYEQFKELIEAFLSQVCSPLNSLQCFWTFLQQDFGSAYPLPIKVLVNLSVAVLPLFPLGNLR